MVSLTFQQYVQLIELRCHSEHYLATMEESAPVPDPRLFSRFDYMKLFHEVLDGLINRYRTR